MNRTLTQLNAAETFFGLISTNLKLPALLLLGIYFIINLNIAKAQNNENACDLPVDIGHCEESNLRFYYSTERGNCQPFYYSGCEGNDNNYESYTACISACDKIVSCPEGDPLEWSWIQDIISEGSLCNKGSISQFESNGNMYFRVGASNKCNLSHSCKYYYDCKGDYVCLSCDLSSHEYPYRCDNGFNTTIQNTTTIWNYEPNCTDPFETHIVKTAIKDGCTDAIYTFDYEDEQYIYLKNTCNFFDVLYSCNVMYTFVSNGNSIIESLFNSVTPMVNEENIIWTNTLEYAHTGTVQESDCGFYIEAGTGGIYEPLIIPDDFSYKGGIYTDPINALQNGLTVEFNYVVLPDSTSCLTNGIPVEIRNMRVIAENCGCHTSSDPVCGKDGENYDNVCLAYCAGVETTSCDSGEVCDYEYPLQEDWMRVLISNGAGCTVNEIRQFQYNESTFFMTLPNKDCTNEEVQYYNCFGRNICCFSEIPEANTIWTYQDACSNPLDLDFVQPFIIDQCTYAIYQFEFNGETFLYVKSDTGCYYDTYDSSFYDVRNTYYCNVGLAFKGVELTGTTGSGILNIIYTDLKEENIIWKRQCAYESKGTVKQSSEIDCLFIELENGGRINPEILPENFNLKLEQGIEFTYRVLSNDIDSSCSGNGVEIICIREACVDNEIAICAPVSIPPPNNLAHFINEDNLSSELSLQVDEQIDVQKYFTTTTYTYTLTDNTGNQKSCASKYHIANQFLKTPEVSQPGIICQNDLWSHLKIGRDQYKLYGDRNGTGSYDFFSNCNTSGIGCSTADLNVNTAIPGRRNFLAITYFEFPDGTPCESEAAPFHIEIQPEPVAALSTQKKTINIGEGIALMDLVNTNKSGYWRGENIVYIMTASGENIAYFSASNAGIYKLYYKVRNEYCEQSYRLVIEVASAGKVAFTQPSYKTIDTAFNIYPNPTTNKVFIDLPGETACQINLIDISGKIMRGMKTAVYQSTVEMDVSDLPKGMYFVELKNENTQSIQKLIIE